MAYFAHVPVFLLLAFALMPACRMSRMAASDELKTAGDSGFSSPLVRTTYFGGSRERGGDGPGNFSCSHLNHVNQWYVAPSDTFGDAKIWDGGPCPARDSGIPECTALMNERKICGRKVKIKCGENCKAGAPEIVLMITDACPKEHRTNKKSGACQGGAAFDISQQAWELMRERDDNIKVYYQRVDDNTPLGPLQALGGDERNGAYFPECTNGSDTGGGYGYQPELGGTNGSCRVPSAKPTPSSNNFPVCTNGSDTGGGYGYQPELGGTNGSCRVPTSDDYPYCTNGSDTGQGFGYQPELKGPNGSCRVPPGGSLDPSRGGSSLSASLKIISQWEHGYCVDLIIKNNAGSAVNSWVIELDTAGGMISQSWNLQMEGSSGRVTVKPSGGWNARIAPGATIAGQGLCLEKASGAGAVTVQAVRAE